MAAVHLIMSLLSTTDLDVSLGEGDHVVDLVIDGERIEVLREVGSFRSHSVGAIGKMAMLSM
jgi:hypothetical protein